MKRLFAILTAMVFVAACQNGSPSDRAANPAASSESSATATETISSPSSGTVAPAAGSDAAPAETQRKTHVVVDSIGREVTLPDPIKRAVIANGYNLELVNAIGAIDAIVGVDYITYSDLDAYGNFFTEDTVIGQSSTELNYEKIIELEPDALIITGNGSWEDAEKKLGPFGIKVVVLNAYYTGEFKRNWTIAGQLFGKEDEARELIDYFEGKLAYIRDQLKDVPKKTLYYEYKRIGNTTIPGDYFHNMVVYSGAQNLYDDAINVEIDPETVITRNPEYIVRVGTSNVNGRYVPPTPEEFARRKNDVVSRPGWDEISAVKNDRILLLSHYSQGAAGKLVGTMYIAKFLYPDELPDLNPEEVFRTWLEKYQRMPYIAGHTVPAYALDERESPGNRTETDAAG
ncbi:MAG: ABC transporter substrate-binding protein [Deltaproteobacteria bacterium]|jgi:iron complex transport system substrate-binding protein|nr:ABC transporter substrate-binding protein [Deltaproteobacteria bacterium]